MAAKTWTLIMGLAGEQRHWGDFPEQMKSIFPADEVECLDLAGFGTERGRTSPSTIAGIARDARARSKSASQRALVGISLGGMVAMSWAAQFSEEVSHLVLINSSTADIGFPHERLRWEAMAVVAKSMRLKDPVKKISRELTISINQDKTFEKYQPLREQIARESAGSQSNIGKQLLAAGLFRAPPASALTMPSLILRSEKDRIVDPVCSLRLAQRYGTALKTHLHAGHELALEEPEWTAEAIHSWLMRLEVRG